MDQKKSLLSMLDMAIQRRFDMFIFFLMRVFGWKKSLIRFILWGIAITSLALQISCQWVLNDRKIGWDMIWGIAMLGLLLMIQLADYVFDRYAESVRMFSLADRPEPANSFFKLLFGSIVIQHLLLMPSIFFGSVRSGVEPMPTVLKASTLFGFVFFLSVLATIYLKRTPPTPPPTKVELRVLVPVQDRST